MQRERLINAAPSSGQRRPPAPVTAPAAALLALQRTHGNRAVSRLVRERPGRRPLQRVVVRFDDPDALKGRRSEDVVKTTEVDRMVEHLGGNAVPFRGSNAIEIDAGDHWFVGHGSGLDIGGVEPPEFKSQLSFASLKPGETATLHLVSCNLGKITEDWTGTFAKHLRKLLQADPALEHKTIIVEAAPAFVVRTPGVEASFPHRPPAEPLERLKQREEEIDNAVGTDLWKTLRTMIENGAPARPTKKALNQYLSALSSWDWYDEEQAKLNGTRDDEARRAWLLGVVDRSAREDPAGFFTSAGPLAVLLGGDAKGALAKAREDMRRESRAAWLDFEQAMLPFVTDAGPETLRADDPRRASIKQDLKAKKEDVRRRYGWIQYSTKGRHKELPSS